MTRTRWVGWPIPLLIFIAVAVGCASRRSGDLQSQRIKEAQVVKEFTDRVQEYAKLHKRLEKELPPLGDKADPAAIASHQQALADALRAARATAKRGDILFPSVESYFLRILRGKLQSPSSSSTRAAVTESTPKKVPLRVNDPYPEGAPLSTVPPTLLLTLPKLPEELEYRFVDRHLVLRDTHAHLIVDFILEVIP